MGELEITYKIERGISPLLKVPLEPVGKVFHEYEHQSKNSTQSEKLSESDNSDDSKQSTKELKIDIDMKFLKSLDHKLWKDQDHYKVLGLHKYRYKATDKDIKKAYRQLMLVCHPDKKNTEEETEEEDYSFLKNVAKAFDILGDPQKRRAYDSVDPDFDDDIPGDKLSNKSSYFKVFGPVFERNARWSLKNDVPLLGDLNSKRESVEHFYEFWYTFESGRDFSYADEDREQAEDKDERWYIDRQNKAERLKKTKEENTRIKKLIDNAYHLDPRIAKFKEEDKEAKQAAKQAKRDEAIKKKQKEQEEQRRLEEEERLKKETEEQEARAKRERQKKEKEETKKQLKIERDLWMEMSKEDDYFICHEVDRVQAMIDVDVLCEGLQLLNLKEIIESVTAVRDDKKEARRLVKEKVDDLKTGRIPNNMVAAFMSSPASFNNKPNKKPQGTPKAEGGKAWSNEELQLLIKAVNLFPAGTNKRWEVVATYLSQHGPNTTTRPAKEVLNKAKELQGSEAAAKMREAAKDSANQVPGVEKKMAKLELMSGSSVNAVASERLETASEAQGVNNSPWSAEEQSRLEQALKTFPASEGAERWDKIAATIPGRSKRDCMKRYKVNEEKAAANIKAALTKALKAKKANKAKDNNKAKGKETKAKGKENNKGAGKDSSNPKGNENGDSTAKENSSPAGKENNDPKVKENNDASKETNQATGEESNKVAGKPNKEVGKEKNKAEGKGKNKATGKENNKAEGTEISKAEGKDNNKVAGKSSNKTSVDDSNKVVCNGSTPGKDKITAEGKNNKTVGKENNKPADKDSNKPAGKETNKPASKGSNKPAGKDSNKPAGKDSDKPAGKDSNKPAAKEDNKVWGKENDKPAGKENNKPAGKENNKPAGKENSNAVGKENNKGAGKDNKAWGKDSKVADPKGSNTAEAKGNKTVNKGANKTKGNENNRPINGETNTPIGKVSYKPKGKESNKPIGKESNNPIGKENSNPWGKNNKTQGNISTKGTEAGQR